MNVTQTPPVRKPFGFTRRRDRWWVEPLLNFCGFTAFVLYATWAASSFKMHGHITYAWPPVQFDQGLGHAPYLSPFYSPLFKPNWWVLSPAWLILIMPLGFRLTCYYYRKMYYRSYFMDPPGCAVADSKMWHTKLRNYKGETVFPFTLQNLHRWFFYLASAVLIVLWYDAINSLWFQAPGGGPVVFHFGLGSAIMFINAFLLSGYSLGCHAFRHLIGGNVDCWSCTALGRTRHGLWKIVSKFNEHHLGWAWASLTSVALTDVYIRLLAGGFGNHPFPYTPWW